MKKTEQETTQVSSDYLQLLDMLNVVATSTTRLAEMQAAIDQDMIDAVNEHKDTYADLQTAISDATAALEAICLAHPEWFKEKKSVKTLFGSVGFRDIPSLEIPCEEITLALLENAADQEPMSGIELAVKTVKTINREVLEKLTDAELARFRVTRRTGKSFSVKPAKVELGKAVSAGEEADSRTADLVA